LYLCHKLNLSFSRRISKIKNKKELKITQDKGISLSTSPKVIIDGSVSNGNLERSGSEFDDSNVESISRVDLDGDNTTTEISSNVSFGDDVAS